MGVNPEKAGKMIIILAPSFTSAVIIDNGKVSKAAPIVKYMKGWTWDTVILYCEEKGWKTVRVL